MIEIGAEGLPEEAEIATNDLPAATEEAKEETKIQPQKPERHTNIIRLVQEFKNVVVQRYLENPCLINGRKFDLRCFMVIICCKPYFVYSQDGYARISLY